MVVTVIMTTLLSLPEKLKAMICSEINLAIGLVHWQKSFVPTHSSGSVGQNHPCLAVRIGNPTRKYETIETMKLFFVTCLSKQKQ